MRNVGGESRKTYQQKLDSGFFTKWMSGVGIDIGYKGYEQNVVSILETAQGIDMDTPGYDGKTLPFLDKSMDYVYSSHTLEHILDYKQAIQEWFRVIKIGGYIITVVPHQWLYEKKKELPSQFNGDHRRFYLASSLLKEFEDSLEVNSFRVRHLRENDEGHNYNDPPEVHGRWLYEIELVIERIK